MAHLARGPSYERTESLQDPLNPQHRLMTGMTPGSNGRKIRVRCRCMAEYKNVSPNYFVFDYIADADSLDRVKVIYENHLRASAILVAVAKFYEKWGE